jgi:hypothetical protein
MPEAQVSVLGGLPVIADVWFSGPDYYGEYDAGVNALYWEKRDGTKGKEVSQKIYDKLDKRDPYWHADVTEQVSEALAYESWENRPDDEKTVIQLFSEPA